MRLFSLLIVLTLMPAPALASVVHDLYTATVPVSSQSGSARAKGLQKALRQVVVRVTGSRDAPDKQQVAAVISKPEQYLQAYQYQRHVPEPGEPLFGPEASSNLDLRARFDPDTLNHALRVAGMSLWGRIRPATVVWAAYEEQNGERHIVSSERAGQVLHAMRKAARNRGVPVVFPLMDVEDRSAVGFSDVWGGFTASVVDASSRYQPDATVIGKIDASGSSATARWTLVLGGKTITWDGGRGAPVDLAGAAIQHLADVYAAKFIGDDDSAGRAVALTIVVSGIRNLVSYAHVLRYLRSLNAIETVEPLKVAGGSVTYQVTARGTATAVQQTIGFGAELESTNAPVSGNANADEAHQNSQADEALHYRYQG